ncbi:hypothetical protein SLA2020_070310 [Shorea laevis]
MAFAGSTQSNRCKKARILLKDRRHCESPMRRIISNWRRRSIQRINSKIRELKAEMQEIGEEQRSIRMEQKKVREKFEEVESKCQQLRRESSLIMQQSDKTRVRLGLMLHILKAREDNDLAKATQLTQVLRELIANQNQNQ